MSPWFAASAVVPELQARLSISAAQAGWLTSVVPLGFVAGSLLAALFNLADVVPGRLYFASCALGGAAANLGVAAAGGPVRTLALRFLTGAFLAGVYAPAMKM